MYSAARENPIRWRDPMGLITEEEIENIIFRAALRGQLYKEAYHLPLARSLFLHWYWGTGKKYTLSTSEEGYVWTSTLLRRVQERAWEDLRKKLIKVDTPAWVPVFVRRTGRIRFAMKSPYNIFADVDTDMFFSFNRLQYQLYYAGWARCDNGSVEFRGVRSRRVWDQYNFGPRKDAHFVEGDSDANDYNFYIWHEYGRPAPFPVEGKSRLEFTMSIPRELLMVPKWTPGEEISGKDVYE